MKQAELNKLLHSVLKDSAKIHDWKFSRGYVFKASELLFFSIIITGLAKLQHLSFSLRYKMLAFDNLFWRIFNMEENLKRSLSLRACGVWTAPTMMVSEGDVPIVDWSADHLLPVVNEIIARCEIDAANLSREIHGFDDNMRVIERLYTVLLTKYPRAAVDIWRERSLTSILKQDYEEAGTIIRSRISANDCGGFGGSRNFYQLADEYLRRLQLA
jgi:hypothetical protein